MLPLALALLLSPPLAQATSAFEDAFFAFAKTRKLEQQVRLLPLDPDLGKSERAILQRELEAQLTEARISFHAVLRSDQENLSPWEAKLLEKVASRKSTGLRTLDAAQVTFLHDTFPDSENLSPLEWDVIGEWFGKANQEQFLRESFHAERLPARGEMRKARLLLLADPYADTAAPASIRELRRAGHEVEVLHLAKSARIDDLAESLGQALRARKGAPAFLVSEGDASAVVLRMLDLAPRMRRAESLAGWINVNGKLYGDAKAADALLRNPARAEALRQRASLRLESLERPTPVGEGFPILNLVNTRESPNLRESLVIGSRSWLLGDQPAIRQVGEALRFVALPFAGR